MGLGDRDRFFATYVTTGADPSIDELTTAVTELDIGSAATQTLIDLLLTTNEYLFAGEYEDAIDKLYDFIDKLEDYMENGTISQLAGEGLIELTDAFIDFLEQLAP